MFTLLCRPSLRSTWISVSLLLLSLSIYSAVATGLLVLCMEGRSEQASLAHDGIGKGISCDAEDNDMDKGKGMSWASYDDFTAIETTLVW